MESPDSGSDEAPKFSVGSGRWNETTVEVTKQSKFLSHTWKSGITCTDLGRTAATRGRLFVTSSREEASKFSAGSGRQNHSGSDE